MIHNAAKNSLLIFTNIIVVSATIYTFLETDAGKQNVSSFIFPNQVPLSTWNQIKNHSLSVEPAIIEEKSNLIVSAKNYQYVRDKLSVNINISYVVNTRGNTNKLIGTRTKIPQNTLKQKQIKQAKHIGFYSVFQDNQNLYLSSCLSSQGKSTVTPQQFSANLNQVKITPSLLGKWLMGKASIRDRRCLWILLSIPLESEVSNADEILKNTWIDLVKWWSPNFPQL